MSAPHRPETTSSQKKTIMRRDNDDISQEERGVPRPRSDGRDPRPLMVQALDSAIEEAEATHRYLIGHGHMVSGDHHENRYCFTVQGMWDVADGTAAILVPPEGDHVGVEIVSSSGDTVTFSTPMRVAARTLQQATLLVEQAQLLRKMKDVLVRDTSSTGIGLRLFQGNPAPDRLADDHSIDELSDLFVPDDAQRLAIRRALASEVQMILGPGGTGKTDVLAAIVMLHALIYRHRVLLCAHTNIAIDNAVIRLAGLLRKQGQHAFLDAQNLVRVGNPHLASLETDAYRCITLSLIIDTALASQREALAHLETRRHEVIAQRMQDEEAFSRHQHQWKKRQAAISLQRQQALASSETIALQEQKRLTAIEEQMTVLRHQLEEVTQVMRQAQASIEEDAQTLQPLLATYATQAQRFQTERKKLDHLHASHPVLRFFRQLVVGERDLEVTIERLTHAVQAVADEIRAFQQHQMAMKQIYGRASLRQQELTATLALWRARREDRPLAEHQVWVASQQIVHDLNQEVQREHRRSQEIEQRMMNADQELTQIEHERTHLTQQVDEMRRDVARRVVSSAQIVGTTLTSVYLNPTVLNQQWDVVVLDEGSMAAPPAVMIVAQRASAHVIILGDPLQLAPVCTFKNGQARHWLGCDVFHLGGYTLQQAGSGTHHSVLLPYQSRMHSDICDLVRELIYKDLLKDREPTSPRPSFDPEPAHAVVLYDTTGVPEVQTLKPGNGRSRTNPAHAKLAILLVCRLLGSMAVKGPECIGVVTPYAAQRDLIRHMLQVADLAMYVHVGTVHAFQGLEFDALVFDTVDAPGMPVSRFTSDRWGTPAMRLLNVAVSRARHKLIIIAHMATIRHEPLSSLLRQMMELAWRKKHVILGDHDDFL